jgi:tetratricopeptide (TPR) repeat protein/predicted Ser/Thr protein kinase
MPREDEPAPPARRPAVPQEATLAGAPEPSPLAGGAEAPRVRVGPFEIRGLLGSGGFGSVYLGEQTEPFPRTAAIKMLGPGRRGERFRELFDAERRVLAQIDHPNVARLLEAGTTPEGDEWIAMEYVPGQPLAAFCDQNRLEIAARVDLLEAVARAVAFAHAKGVVHRDLKPANILVTSEGGAPVPKVIDFGIARMLGEAPAGAEPDRALGTPGYMAPEQTTAGGADADARSDVHALGAVLFHLCCGAPPLADPGGAPVPAEDLARRTRERDAPRMSAFVRALPRAAAEQVAADRRTTPHGLAHMLRGDLDWIVARCLERDRQRRYANAGELVEDLRRWRARRPVEAAPDTMRYRAGKFVERNRPTVLLSAMLAVAVLAGLAASVTGWRSALHERDLLAASEARTAKEAAAARSAATYISAVLSAASVDRAPDGAALSVADLLERAARAADVELAGQPATEAIVRLSLGRTFASLGMLDQAQVQLLRANALEDATHGRMSAETAETLEALAQVALLRRNTAAARALLAEARATFAALPGDQRAALGRVAMQVAEVDLEAGQAEAALARLDEAEALLRAAAGGGTAGDGSIGGSTGGAGGSASDGGVAAAAPALAAATPAQGSIEWYRALAYLDLARYPQALAAIERNIAINRARLPADHWWIAESQTVRAAALAGMGRTAEALEIIRTAMPVLEHALQPGAPTLRKAFARAAFVATRAGAMQEAAQYRALADRPPAARPALPPGTPGRAATSQGQP